VPEDVRRMKTCLAEFGKKAEMVKKSDRYEVYDLAVGNLVLSMTVLHPGKATTGHSHEDTEEISLFVRGDGEIELDGERQPVRAEDVVAVPREVFHRVFNTGDTDLEFLCFFERRRYRGC